jgi:hypothetical protein
MDKGIDNIIHEVAQKHGADPALIQQLVEYEQTKVHLERRRGAKEDLRRRIEQHIDEHQQ